MDFLPHFAKTKPAGTAGHVFRILKGFIYEENVLSLRQVHHIKSLPKNFKASSKTMLMKTIIMSEYVWIIYIRQNKNRLGRPVMFRIFEGFYL
jgi:hypothetical protein